MTPRSAPLQVVNGGSDRFQQITASVQLLRRDAGRSQLPVTFAEHPEGQHGFDFLDRDDTRDSPTSAARLSRRWARASRRGTGGQRAGTEVDQHGR
jgi:acetyl esterase/lipase